MSNDALLTRINLALDPVGETVRAAKNVREIGMYGRFYSVDHLGRVVQRDVCLSALAVELGVLSRTARKKNDAVANNKGEAR